MFDLRFEGLFVVLGQRVRKLLPLLPHYQAGPALRDALDHHAPLHARFGAWLGGFAFFLVELGRGSSVLLELLQDYPVVQWRLSLPDRHLLLSPGLNLRHHAV